MTTKMSTFAWTQLNKSNDSTAGYTLKKPKQGLNSCYLKNQFKKSPALS